MIQEILYDCKIDSSRQPAMFCAASGDDARPLLVGLHIWSYNHTDYYKKFAALYWIITKEIMRNEPQTE